MNLAAIVKVRTFYRGFWRLLERADVGPPDDYAGPLAQTWLVSCTSSGLGHRLGIDLR